MASQDDGNEHPILGAEGKSTEQATGKMGDDKNERDSKPNAMHVASISEKRDTNVGRLFMKKLIEEATGEVNNDVKKDEDHSEDITVKQSVLLNSPLDLKTRVLNLSQRRDWVACETALRILERKTSESDDKKPLLSVIDEVRQEYARMPIHMPHKKHYCAN